MKKRLITVLLLSCFALTGCVSKAEFDALESDYNALEERVSRLENSNSSYTHNQTANEFEQLPVSKYIKNWDEVITVLEQEFGRSDFTIIEDTASMNVANSDASIMNFGNGTYFLFVDGSKVKISVKEYTAIFVEYIGGDGNHRVETPSYSDELYYGD